MGNLEEYNYDCPKPTLIRPTEKTVVARLPPRIAIREDAPLELPHIIMIIDDPGKTVLEPLFTTEGLSEPEYECTLFKGAGSVKGLKVTQKGTEHVAATIDNSHWRWKPFPRHAQVVLGEFEEEGGRRHGAPSSTLRARRIAESPRRRRCV